MKEFSIILNLLKFWTVLKASWKFALLLPRTANLIASFLFVPSYFEIFLAIKLVVAMLPTFVGESRHWAC